MNKIDVVNSLNSKLRENTFNIDDIAIEMAIEYVSDLGYQNPEKFVTFLISNTDMFPILYQKFIRHFCIKYGIIILSFNNKILNYYVSD